MNKDFYFHGVSSLHPQQKYLAYFHPPSDFCLDVAFLVQASPTVLLKIATCPPLTPPPAPPALSPAGNMAGNRCGFPRHAVSWPTDLGTNSTRFTSLLTSFVNLSSVLYYDFLLVSLVWTSISRVKELLWAFIWEPFSMYRQAVRLVQQVTTCPTSL